MMLLSHKLNINIKLHPILVTYVSYWTTGPLFAAVSICWMAVMWSSMPPGDEDAQMIVDTHEEACINHHLAQVL